MADIKKNKDGLGYAGSDGRTSRDVADCATSWSTGAVAKPDVIINESKEQANAAMTDADWGYAASLYKPYDGGSNMPNPHNKQWGGGASKADDDVNRAAGGHGEGFGPGSTGSGAYGDELQRSYHIDPPMGDNTALSGLAPGPSVLGRGGSTAGAVNPNIAKRSDKGTGGLQAMPSLDAGNVGGPQDAGGIETGSRGTL